MASFQNQGLQTYLPARLSVVREPQLTPDTEENVESQAEGVCRSYFSQSYENDLNRGAVEDMPVIEELLHLPRQSLPEADIGRQLAKFGDEINEKYGDIFDSMISQLNISSSTSDHAYEHFSEIARRVFEIGSSWGSIVILLSFGYRMAINLLRSRASEFMSFLSRIVGFICRFLITERIAKWIAERGGWRAALSYIPLMSSKPFWVLTAVQVAVVFGILFRQRL